MMNPTAKSDMKNTIAKVAICVALALVAASFLPWTYLKPSYYIFRYVIIALMALSTALTFSFKRTFSRPFMKIFIGVIAVVAVEFLLFKIFKKTVHLEDLTQLMIAFLCICLGMNMKDDLKFWRNVAYYYTVALVAMGLINCYFYAKGFYVPEYYLFNRGKNQVGMLMATGAAALFFFGMKDKEWRVHFWLVFFLAVLVLLLIRARTATFSLLACMLMVSVKDGNWKWKWSPMTFISIAAAVWIGYILYTGFIGDELHTFFSGGKNLNHTLADNLSSNRLERDLEGMREFSRNPVSGELSQSSGIKLIHNYFILRGLRYGIWAIPFLLFYLYFGIRVLWGCFRSWRTDVTQVGFVVCTLPFLASFFEPSFPYGPGEVQLLVFLLFGFSMRTLSEQQCTQLEQKPQEPQIWYRELHDLWLNRRHLSKKISSK